MVAGHGRHLELLNRQLRERDAKVKEIAESLVEQTEARNRLTDEVGQLQKKLEQADLREEALRTAGNQWMAKVKAVEALIAKAHGPRTLGGVHLPAYVTVYALRRVVRADAPVEQLSDDDLPGMWSHSDFMGGDPDERSYAQREREQRLSIDQQMGHPGGHYG